LKNSTKVRRKLRMEVIKIIHAVRA